MNLYIVFYYDGIVKGIYDLEGILTIYSTLVRNPPLYRNRDYWDNCSVSKIRVNTDDLRFISPEDIRPPLGLDKK